MLDELRAARVLSALPEPALQQLAADAQLIVLEPGQTIVRQGEAGDALYVILAGRCAVSLSDGDDRVPLAVLEAGEVFGEAALFTRSGRRTADVRSVGPARVARIGVEAVARLRAADTDFDVALAHLAEQSLIDTFLRTASPFRALEPAVLEALAGELVTVEVGAGHVLAREGEPGDAAWLVMDGAVEVVRESVPRVLATALGRGTLIGELALLGDEPRNATVRTLSPTTLLCLRRATVRRLLDGPPTGRGVFQDLALARGRPARAPGVAAHRREDGSGAPVYVLTDARPRYFQLSERGYFLWGLMDGGATIGDLISAYVRAYQSFAPHVVTGLVERLAAAGFLAMAIPPAPTPRGWRAVARRIHGALEWRRAVFEADGLAGVLHRVVAPALPVLAPIAALVAIAGLIAWFAAPAISTDLPAWALPLLYGWLIVELCVHEAGHAIAVKHHGRRVGAAGVGWLWVTAAAYVDTSDMWLAPRRARLAVDLAGVAVDATLGGLLALLALSGEGLLSTVLWSASALAWLSVITNLNPLLELDGYHALSDALDRPHLRREAFGWLAGALRPGTRAVGGWVEATFALGAVGYLVAVCAALLVIVRPALEGVLHAVLGRLAGSGAWAITGAACMVLMAGLIGAVLSAERWKTG